MRFDIASILDADQPVDLRGVAQGRNCHVRCATEFDEKKFA
jgi:hypothetical protein